MLRKLIIAGLFVLGFGLVVANAQEIGPTSDNNQQVNINVEGLDGGTGTSASVTQQVNVTVPKATALHSTAGSLSFDISQIGNQDSTWYCVQGAAANASSYGTLNPATGDYEAALGSDFYGQTQVLPMGTYYNATNWPNVAIVGQTHVSQYPPAELDGGALVPGSKEYFVCYRTFVLQTFSNFSNYDLQVSRSGTTDVQAYPEPIYIQGNTYCSYTQDQGTGLFALPSDGGPVAHLIPVSLGTGPTGAAAEACGQPGYKSWLDDLVVVAVKIDGEHWGQSSTTLTYTLFSADQPFN